NITTLACPNRVPVAESYSPVVTAAGDGNSATILLGTVDSIWELVVGNDVIELRGWLVVPGSPAVASIYTDDRSLVAAGDHALRIGGIDPECVIVVAARRTFNRLPALSGILAAIKRDIGQVNNVGILRIHGHLAEVPEPAEDSGISPDP